MRQPIGDVAFCYSWADEVLAHKIMDAFKPLEQEGLMHSFIPEYTDEGESTVVNANVCLPLLSDMFMQDELLREDAFSCHGCGQLILPILLDACDFKSIEAMQPHEVYVSRDKKEIKEMEYLLLNDNRKCRWRQ